MAARKNNTTTFVPPGEFQKAREATFLRGTARISLQIVTIVVICIYLQLFLYLLIFIVKIIYLYYIYCCSYRKKHIFYWNYCIYYVFIVTYSCFLRLSTCI